jgi:hypothetical protein
LATAAAVPADHWDMASGQTDATEESLREDPMSMNDAMAIGPRAVVRVARIRQAAVSVALAGLLAMLVAGATMEAADAKGASHSSQNSFVKNCKQLGGTPKRIESRVVECSFPKKDDGSGGGSVTCDFNQQYYTCKYKLGPGVGATDVPFDKIEDMIGIASEPASKPGRPAIRPTDNTATT